MATFVISQLTSHHLLPSFPVARIETQPNLLCNSVIKSPFQEESTRDRAVLLLLSKGADVNACDDTGRTALSYACELRCNDVIDILLKNNVDPNIPDVKGKFCVTPSILSVRSKMSRDSCCAGNTPLMYCAMKGNDTGLKKLIRSFKRFEFDVNHVNEDGCTALILAAKEGCV